MSEEKDFVFNKLLSKAKTKPTTVKLNELVLLPEQFCHRDLDALKKENLQTLRDSLIAEGLHNGPHFHVDQKARKVALTAHRRLTTLRWCADDGVPGFTHDMQIPATEVFDAGEEDLLLWSVGDNETSVKLDPISRIKVAKKLHDLKVPKDRAARALGVVTLTYLHDVLIAEHDWMYEYVIKHCIQPTAAHRLLEAAKGKDRLDDLRKALDAKIMEINLFIALAERKHKELKGKDLPENKKVVKNLFDTEIVPAWIAQLKANKPLSEEVTAQFAAGIDPEAHELRIGNYSLDLENTDAKQLAKIASRLTMIAKTLPSYILKALNKTQVAKSLPLDDTSILREAGLTDLAEQIEKEDQQAAVKEKAKDEPKEAVEDEEEVQEDEDEVEDEDEEEETPTPPPPPSQVKPVPPVTPQLKPPTKKPR